MFIYHESMHVREREKERACARESLERKIGEKFLTDGQTELSKREREEGREGETETETEWDREKKWEREK